jgi:hypothetical protein
MNEGISHTYIVPFSGLPTGKTRPVWFGVVACYVMGYYLLLLVSMKWN